MALKSLMQPKDSAVDQQGLINPGACSLPENCGTCRALPVPDEARGLRNATGWWMDGTAFKAMLGELGYTQASFSRAYRIHIRTVENWVRIGPPDFLAHILTDMLRASIPSPNPETPLDYTSKQGAKRALDPSLRSVVDRAVRAGWSREIIASAAIEWFSDEFLTKR